MSASSATAFGATYTKETLISGKPAQITCVEIDGQVFSMERGGPVRTIRLDDESYDDVRDPELVVRRLRESRDLRADVFTFCQRLPESERKHDYLTEWESMAVLPITSYDHWWDKQLRRNARNKVRKSQKAGVEVREAVFDDAFVRGMSEIFNEAPIRQGRRFWHYGKDPETVRRQFSRFLFREDLIGAYYEEKLIGFAMLGNAGRYGDLVQIVSKIEHRDKATNNALLAKAVELCAKRSFPYLVYAFWNVSSLADFKRDSGFEEVKLPRYFVPLNRKGELAIKLGLHRGWKAAVPSPVKEQFKKLRKSWYARSATTHSC